MQHQNVTFLSLSLSNSFFEKPTFSISPLLFLWYNFSIIHITIERRYHEFFLLTKEAFLRCPADDRRKHCQAADSICASAPCRKSVSAALQHCWQYCCGQLCQQDGTRSSWFYWLHYQHHNRIFLWFIHWCRRCYLPQFWKPAMNKALHCTVHTTIALTLVLAVFFTIAGLFLSPFFLR